MRRRALSLSLIAAAVLLVYSNTIKNGFVWDDRVMVEGNAFIADPANLLYLLDPRYYTGAHAVLAGTRPVFLASLCLDHALWGNAPWGYHLTSVLLHATNSLWVYALAMALFPAGPVPLLSGLFFGLHPIQTEAVNAVSFRSDLLAAFFLFPALWAYLKARESSGKTAALLVAASAGLYGLGLLSKEMAASLPAMALLAELSFPSTRDRGRRLALALGAYAAVALAFTAFWAPRFRYANLPEPSSLRSGVDSLASRLTLSSEVGPLPIAGPEKSLVFAASPPPWTALYESRRAWFWSMSKAFAGYFRLLAYPKTLVADRAPEVALDSRAPGARISAIFLVLLLIGALLLRRRQAPISFGMGWCWLSLLPVSGLLPLYNPVAERYLYLACAGLAWALARGLGLAWGPSRRRKAGALALAGLLLAAYALRTRARNRDWKSEEALFLDAAAAQAMSPRARYIRAGILREKGRGREAAAELEEALLRHPRFSEAWLLLAMTYGDLEQVGKAGPCFEKALAFAPRNPVFHFAYALFLARAGNAAEAAARYRSAIELDPGYVQAWVNLAALYRDQGLYRKARACYEKAVALAGQDPTPFYSYALLLERTGEPSQARAMYRAALDRDPSYTPAAARLARLKPR